MNRVHDLVVALGQELHDASALPAPNDFDEAGYLTQNADVAAAVAQGQIASAYLHYILFGRKEGRPRPSKLS